MKRIVRSGGGEGHLKEAPAFAYEIDMKRNYFLEGLASIGQGLASIGQGLVSIVDAAFTRETDHYYTYYSQDYSNVTLDSPMEQREGLAKMLEEFADSKDEMAASFDAMRMDFREIFGERYDVKGTPFSLTESAKKDRAHAAALRKGRT